VIIKFKRQFRNDRKLGLPSPWSTDPWIQPKESYIHMLLACRDDMQFNIGEDEVFSRRTIVKYLGKYFTILTMLIDLLINQPARPYYLSTKL